VRGRSCPSGWLHSVVTSCAAADSLIRCAAAASPGTPFHAPRFLTAHRQTPCLPEAPCATFLTLHVGSSGLQVSAMGTSETGATWHLRFFALVASASWSILLRHVIIAACHYCRMSPVSLSKRPFHIFCHSPYYLYGYSYTHTLSIPPPSSTIACTIHDRRLSPRLSHPPSHSHPLLVSALVAPLAWSFAAEAQSRMLSAAAQLKVQAPPPLPRLPVPLPSSARVAFNTLSNTVHKALDT